MGLAVQRITNFLVRLCVCSGAQKFTFETMTLTSLIQLTIEVAGRARNGISLKQR